VWAFSSPELSVLRLQYKQFEPLGWFTKATPIAAIFFAPFKSALPIFSKFHTAESDTILTRK
jgi:hypothetical protein